MTTRTSAHTYSEAINDAFERLDGLGFEFGPNFAAHAPMAAETLVTLGHHDLVPSFIEKNRKRRGYYEPPPAFQAIPDDEPVEWRRALGDYRRVTDWVAFFDRRLQTTPWREVLVEWWPALLDGAFAAFTHGLIRTAHAVRSLITTPEPSRVQLHELACALGYWAARHAPVPGPRGDRAHPAPAPGDVPAALSELTVAYAGRYADHAPRPAVPLVHSITAPAAVRLVLPVLPPVLQVRSYEVARRLAVASWLVYPCGSGDGPATAPDYRPPSSSELVAVAVETRDEHAIKLAEACRREYAVCPDDRYLAASHTLISRYMRGWNADE